MTGRSAGTRRRQSTAKRHIVQVVAGAQTVWTALPPAGQRHMDQSRVDLLQPGAGKAQLVQGAGTKALDQDIGALDQLLEAAPVFLAS